MSRISRVFRIWMLLAVLAGAFSPLHPEVLNAEDDVISEPTVEVEPASVDNPDDNPEADQPDEFSNEPAPDEEIGEIAEPKPTLEPTPEPTAPQPGDDKDDEYETPDVEELTPVTPAAPAIAECGDASAIQLPTGPEEVGYTIVDLGEGSYVVEARIVDPSAFVWNELTEPWTLENDVATYPVTVDPCVNQEVGDPEEQSEVEEPDEREIGTSAGDPILLDCPEPTGDSVDATGQSDNGDAARSSNTAATVSNDVDCPEFLDGLSVSAASNSIEGLSVAVGSDPEGTVSPGDEIEYTVVVIPDTPYPISFSTVTALPADVTFVQVDRFQENARYCNYVSVSHSVECGLVDGWYIGGGSTAYPDIFWITVVVDQPQSSQDCPESVEVSVEGSGHAYNSSATWNENNTAFTSNSIVCEPELSVDLSPETQTIEQDDSFELQMTITNDGPAVSGVGATVALPNWEYISSLYLLQTPSDDCYMNTHGIEVICTNLSIPANGSLTIPIEATPHGRSATCGTYPITATVDHESAAPVTEELTIKCNVDYGWTQSVSDANPAPGDELQYTLLFENTGNTYYTLNIKDALPELPSDAPWHVSVAPTMLSETVCQGADQASFTTTSEIDCTIHNAVQGASVTITATGIVPAASADVNMCGTHESNAMAVAIDPYSFNAEGHPTVISELQQSNVPPTGESAVTVECASIQAEIYSDVPSDEATYPGDEITYTVEVANTGDVEIANYSLFINLDWALTLDQLTFVSEPAECEPFDGVYIDCSVADFAPNTAHTFVFTAIVNDDLTSEHCDTDIVSEAHLYASQIPDAEQPIIASDSSAIECTTGADFEMSAVNETVLPGESIVYTMILENTGTLVLNDIDIENQLPTLPEGGTWTVMIDGEGGSFPYNIDSLAHGESVNILIESSPIPDELTLPESEWCGNWSNFATATGTFSNDDELDASSGGWLRVNCTGLSIETEASAELVEFGEEVTFTITLRNHGNTEVKDVVVEYDIPGNGAFENWQTSSDACDVDDGITCQFDEIERYEEVTIEITALAPTLPTAQQCAPVDHLASFTYQRADAPTISMNPGELAPPDTRIESNTVTTRLDCQPSMEISSDAELVPGEDGRMDAGDSIVYTITVTNSGNMAIYGTSGTAGSDVEMDWDEQGNTIDHLAPGESSELTATYEVTQADLDAGEISHTMSATGGLEPGQSTGSVTIHSFGMAMMQASALDTISADVIVVSSLQQVAGMDFEVSATGDEPIGIGETVIYTFIVSNTGNVTLNDVSIDSPLEGLVWNGDPVIPMLVPGESAQFTAIYMVTDSDAKAGEIVVAAEVSAIDQTDSALTASDSIAVQVGEEATPEPTPDVTPEATPGITPDATPAPGAPDVVDPTAESVTGLPETGTGGAIGLGQMMWAAIVVSALALVACVGFQRRRY